VEAVARMTGWNLPPGCTDQDIDLASGAAVVCSSCGRIFYPSEAAEKEHEEGGRWICNKQMCWDPDSIIDQRRDERLENE